MKKLVFLVLLFITSLSFGQAIDSSKWIKNDGSFNYNNWKVRNNLIIPTKTDTSNKISGLTQIIGTDLYFVATDHKWKTYISDTSAVHTQLANQLAAIQTNASSITGKQSQLNGNGFVKATGTSISYDNTSYFPAEGGVLSGTAGNGYVGFTPQLTTPTVPPSGFKLFASSAGAFSWLTTQGYMRELRIRNQNQDFIGYFQNKPSYTLGDSADVAAKADKTNTISINGSAQQLGNNPSFTISGGTGGTADTTFFNAKTKYGADNTGVTDATVSIQNAINAAHLKGGTVYLPGGVYVHNNKLTLYSNVSIMGDGINSTTLKSTAATPAFEFAASGLNYNTGYPMGKIQSLKIDGNSIGTIGINVKNYAEFNFHDLQVVNFPSGVGINMAGGLIGSFRNIYFDNNQYHVKADTSTDLIAPNLLTFDLCWFNTASKWGVYWRRGASVQFNACNFEFCGVQNDTTSGAVYYGASGNLNNGGAQNVGMVFNGCWFERDNGIGVLVDEPTTESITTFTNTTITAVAGNQGFKGVKVIGATTKNKVIFIGGECSQLPTADGVNASIINMESKFPSVGATLFNGAKYKEIASEIVLSTTGTTYGASTYSSVANKTTISLPLANQSPFYVFRNHNQAASTPSWGNIDSSEFGGVFQPQVAKAMQNFQNGWTMPFSDDVNSMGKDQGSTVYFANRTSGAGLKGGAGVSGASRVMANSDGTVYVLGSKVSIGGSSPNSIGHIQGSFATALASKTAQYILTINDHIILADATTAAYNVTLPTAVGITGRQYIIKKTDASANAVTVATTSSQTIDGSATYPITAQNQYVTVVSDGANWKIIGK